MRKLMTRRNLVLLLVALIALSAVLVAGARRDEVAPGQGGEEYRTHPEQPFQQCPMPPCMAPCVFGTPPEVECKTSDGVVSETTYFCCCCGSAGNQFRSL